MDVNEIAAQNQIQDAPQRRTTARTPAAGADEHDDVPVQEHPPPTLEAEISQLTSSLTSWWGSVTKQSQATLDQARTHIQKQGGILNAAKSEWSKLEEHLNDAQKRARDAAFSPADEAVDAEKKSSSGPGPVPAPSEDDILEASAQASSADKKGKGRAQPNPAIEGDEDGAQKSERSARQEDDVPQMISADGTAIFDAALPSPRTGGGAHNRNSASIDLNAVAKEAQVQATQFANNASSFFSRIGTQLASDPRVANLQKSLVGSLGTNAAGQGQGEAAAGVETEKTEGGARSARTTADGSTASGSAQNALPSWSTTQALARKYWAEAEAVARDVGRDVRDLVNEVVQVVPPSETEHASGASGGVTREGLQGEVDKIAKEREYAEKNKREAAAAAANKKGKTAGPDGPEDDEFAWDEDEDEAHGKEAAGKGKAKQVSPTTPSSTDAASSTATPAPASAEAAPAATSAGVPVSKSRDSDLGLETTTGPRTDRFEASSQHSAAGDDEEGDSDWE
ncbi:hypothetical protein OC842_000043 [Tilletia horrida]|uniref:BSD domain-containing protein n=1 Tax=Tilletia horrida TaxID=155126 RepID=A0AAN6GK23_9BASI|nr:hypothetical protein OC842_000043 [Tilletia horrida]